MMNLIIGICLIVSSFLAPLDAQEAAQRDMRVTDASGQVTLRTADNPKQAVRLDGEVPLAEDDVLETGPNSRAEVVVDRETVFQLQANTRLAIKKIFLKNTQLELKQGQMLAKVKHASQPDQSLIIKMPTAVVAIRGTEFGLGSRNGVSYVGVFDEGEVVVAGAWGHEHVILRPNQETRVTLSNVPRPPYSLQHFKSYRKQVPLLRARAAYWRKNWRPLTPWGKDKIRKNLSNPNRTISRQFRQTGKPKRRR